MNIYQNVNNGLFFGAIAALIAGLGRVSVHDQPPAVWLFTTFFVLFRLKMFLDDHRYFATASTDNSEFKIGFLLGIASWIFWAWSGTQISQLSDACYLLGIGITIATLWVAVVALRQGQAHHFIWVGTNAACVALLWSASRRHGTDWITVCFLGAAILIVLVDLTWSKSIS
ncbi:MAG TPA: hypothetical protein VGJ51_01205 [Candidatus Angelobacter sp.]